MSKHTPGPWLAGTHRTVSTSEFMPIADIYSGGPGIEQADANQNLIAAAPDLLAALHAFVALDKSFSTACDRHIAAIVDRRESSAPMARAVQLARAAIAKAEGRA